VSLKKKCDNTVVTRRKKKIDVTFIMLWAR